VVSFKTLAAVFPVKGSHYLCHYGIKKQNPISGGDSITRIRMAEAIRFNKLLWETTLHEETSYVVHSS